MRTLYFLLFLVISMVGAAPTADQCSEEMKRLPNCFGELTNANGTTKSFDACFGVPSCEITKETIHLVSTHSRKWAAIWTELHSCVSTTKFTTFVETCNDSESSDPMVFECVGEKIKKEDVCTSDQLKKFKLMKSEFVEMLQMKRKYSEIVKKLRTGN